MEGWIICRGNRSTGENYETNRFIEESKKHNIRLKVYRPEQIDLVVSNNDNSNVFVEGKQVKAPDFILPRIGGEETKYYTLAVTRYFEKLGIPCINSSLSIETVKDKLFSTQILAQHNIPVPKTMLINNSTDINLIEKSIKFPAVVKTLSGSFGKGVYLAQDKKSLQEIIDLVEITNAGMNLLIQEYISASHGRDLRVFVVNGRAISCMQRTSIGDEFRANFSLGGNAKKHPLTPEIEYLAVQSAKVSGLEIAGVDLLFDKDHFKVCEINAAPGFELLESSVDINIPKKIFQFIKSRYGVHEYYHSVIPTYSNIIELSKEYSSAV